MFRTEGSPSVGNGIESVEAQAGSEPLALELQQNNGIFFDIISRYEYMIDLQK